MLSPAPGRRPVEAAPPARGRRVRAAAAGLTVLVFLLEIWLWLGWKVSHDLMHGFRERRAEAAARPPAPRP